ncbi:MAG: four helix bundle suffix domain-containing protein [Muribaculaceae bacterium]|nr:four helix bundle suffix domain-containing protein [Muribaculaceae bacterium]
MNKSFLPAAGGYRSMRVYKLSEIIHDLTVVFADTFVERGSRTRDQMVQAARSGKQNIAEGSEASATSKETEIKLTNVAKASLEELLIDYEDYLRQHSLNVWPATCERVMRLREYLRTEQFMTEPLKYSGRMNAEEFCNLCITLINQCTYMLRRLLQRQQEQFLEAGGIKERMYRARVEYRQNLNRASDRSDKSDMSDQSDGSDSSENQ